MLEDGRLTDGKGRTVDFLNAVIIMTSKVGASELKKQTTLGFQAVDEEQTYEVMKEKVMTELKRTFRPEFLNRVDEVIVFPALSEAQLSEIVRLMLQDLRNLLAGF